MTLAADIWSSLCEDKLVDVEVTVSEGTWAVHGQTLRWWYDVPPEGAEPREYTLEIRRAGGAMKAKHEQEEGWSWFQNLCPPESCSIM